MNYLPLMIFFAIVIISSLLKMPIAYTFIVASTFYYLIQGSNVGIIATKIIENYYTSYVIIAIPLFIFTANVLNTSKISDVLFKFAAAIVGNKRGGLAHVNILLSLIFAGMSGSNVADTAGLGIMEIKAMKDANYDDAFSCAITAASSTLGPIFPPSIGFVMYSIYTNSSIPGLFLGGMIPALIITIALMVYVSIVSRIRNYPYGEAYTLRQIISLTLRASPSLLTPLILLGGLYTGVMTATEAAAVSGLYATIIAFLVYKTLSLKDFLDVVKKTIIDTAGIGIIIGTSTVLSYLLQREGLGILFVDFVSNITSNKYIFLFVINVAFLIFGCFLDGSVILLIIVPLIIPVIKYFNINLIHFGVVIVLNTMIGTITPPFGMGLFITANISKTPFSSIIKEMKWPIIALLIVLVIVTYIPQTVLFLPSFFGY